MTIIKEIFILLLFTVAIILVLGIMFYEYIPFSRTISEPEAYVTSEDIRAELEANVVIFTEQNTSASFEVGSSDLDYYVGAYKYVPGKVNPFAEVSIQTNTEIDENTTNSNGTVNTTVPTVNTTTQNKK